MISGRREAHPETIKPEPPTICGNQKTQFNSAWSVRWLAMPGRAVTPEIQKTLAPKNCAQQARKPSSRM